LARIYPFQPYRYSAKAGPVEDLVTQPYDKISPAMQARYLSLNPYNLVRLILGERFPSDSDQDNVYTRAAATLHAWIAAEILEHENAPSLYAYYQRFTVPDTGQTLERKGFIGLGALENYSAGVIHRHEQTLSGPKKDRLELLRHTRTHFELLFLLYPDPYASRAQWCQARVRQTEARLQACDATPLVIVNHFPLTDAPTKVLLHPEFAQWCGTTLTADWHRRFNASVVVYGHLHIPRTTWQDGVRFEEVSLGYPREWHRRSARPTLRTIAPAAEPA